MEKLNDNYKIMCEHIKSVLDAYREMVSIEQGTKEWKDYEEKFYHLVNYKIK